MRRALPDHGVAGMWAVGHRRGVAVGETTRGDRDKRDVADGRHGHGGRSGRTRGDPCFAWVCRERESPAGHGGPRGVGTT